MTIDIETILVDGKHRPYLICGYAVFEGKEVPINAFANDLTKKGELEMLKDFLRQILNDPRFSKVKYIYAHNLSAFDGIFLLRNLIDMDVNMPGRNNINPLIHNGRLYSIKYKIEAQEGLPARTLIFKDSYLLLPASLRELGQTFSTINIGKGILAKGYLPFKLNDLNYIGEFPSKDLYPSNLSVKDYLELKRIHIEKYGDVWNFRFEAHKYCMLDCLILLPGQKF